MEIIIEIKTCIKCLIEKEITEFPLSKAKYRSECKKCMSQYNKEHKKKLEERHSDDILIPDFQKCCRCLKLKESDCFTKSKRVKSGLINPCKECNSERVKQNRKILYERSPNELPTIKSKKCSKCLETKESKYFYKLMSQKSGLYYHCIECDSKIGKIRSQKLQNYIDKRRAKEGCKHCRESDFEMLTNNHIDPSTKTANICDLSSIKEIEKEWVEIKFRIFHF